MLKKIKNKKIVIISLCIMVLLLVIGTSVALWTRTFTQTGVNTNTTDCFNVTFSEGNSVSQTNLYPQTDEQGLTNTPYQVTITNTCNIAASYNVVLHKDNISTLDNSHIKVAVDNNTKLLSSLTSKTSSIDSSIYTAYEIGLGVVPGNTSKTINIRSWMEANTSQSDGENKSFNYKITIEASPNSNLLAAKVFKTSVNTTAPTSEAFRYGEPTTQAGITPSGSGLFAAQDDDGTSYYFRGNIKNNYVNFGTHSTDVYHGYTRASSTLYIVYNTLNECNAATPYSSNCTKAYSQGDPIVWKIVRINGDGTLRLIADDIIGSSAYNTDYEGHKYVGYTYDNSKICTKASPCTGNEGTNSTIKTYLESFYTNNLQSIDSKIAPATYCNDTTYTVDGGYYYYGSYNRINSYAPQLTCPDTTVNYGGNYKLKIGLISADELNMAGYGWDSATTSTNYLGGGGWFWSGSPYYSYSGNAYVHSGWGGRVNSYGDGVQYDTDVRPVINLKSDVKVTGGDGTASNPYVIDTN